MQKAFKVFGVLLYYKGWTCMFSSALSLQPTGVKEKHAA